MRLWWQALPVVVGLASCGTSPETGLSGGNGSPPESNEGDASTDGAGISLGPTTGGDSAPPQFISFVDSSTQSFSCKPGTYSGPFSTKVTEASDAGGLLGLFASLFQYPWMGTLSITLVGMTTGVVTGENDYTMLTIAPGAQLSGVDQTGGHFSADISGTLDCSTDLLTGTLSNGAYEFPGDAGSLSMQGTISAMYGKEGDAGTPALSGDLTASSQQLQGTEAAGTWSAALQ